MWGLKESGGCVSYRLSQPCEPAHAYVSPAVKIGRGKLENDRKDKRDNEKEKLGIGGVAMTQGVQPPLPKRLKVLMHKIEVEI